jgi:sterol desaturase/sphingolipid hydroxylase (fatty acid hydroxylase superfamily)
MFSTEGGVLTVAVIKQFTPLTLYAVVVLCLCLLAANDELSGLSILLLLGAGFLSWSPIEYVLHRFIFHYNARSSLGRKLLYHAHISHHENPEATSRHIASLLLSAPIASVYWLIAFVVTGSSATASYLLIGMAAGYVGYQWIHFQCHHGKSSLRLLRYLRRYHLLHHYQSQDLRFGVTSPLVDLIFGTFRPIMPHRLNANRRDPGGNC